ncbi:DUF2808 domain-containing protein [Calothrix sp. FACHB-1219]|uniref:DUF2808 domain-containing protein n=1 Tax=unclassified Calothrix TaxID=2619626 RepID=UPI001689C90A|nr:MULTISPECIES: DUF2808 domain-containing protein [unclassified Calothrix]MBD2204830.1 DUF2808 domain-containing protein [Calothrix sp. FACHB-168]MBD2218022.1 DUF2808 domain-containing protein [Calothrix sp. FACHB-1219]
MKGFIFGALSTLILATSATAIATPAPSQQLIAQAQSQTGYTINVPHITGSGVSNNTHFIRVAVDGMSVQDLMITLPYQMERFEQVQIKDQSGREIAAKTQSTKGRLTITFDQPVTPGNSIEVQFAGVRNRISSVRTLLYGVTAQRMGLQGDIPVGTARIDLPDQS